jgi:arylsulfatase
MPDQAPHIILFTTDQHRGDHLSIAGHPTVETPNVDSWIQRGAYFPHAYTEIPSTTGARRVLHGGQASHRCGLIGYSAAEWHEPNTLAAVLAGAGYHCLSVGWRNMHPRRKLYGFHSAIVHDLREGVDDYWDWLRRELGPQAHERTHGSDANGWLGRPWDYEERYHATNWTVDVSLDQIAKRDPTRPMFLWCSHMRPHSPYDPPRFFWDMYIDQDLPEIPVGDWAGGFDVPGPGLERTAYYGRLTDAQNQRMRAGYMGCITHIDYQLGYMMERVRQILGNNVLWLFTSDHGDMMGDHCLHRKCYAYEGSARVPFVVQYPGGWELPTGTFDQVVGLQDVMPTLLESAGVDIPDSVTGSSVLAAARGEPWREFFHGEHSPCYSRDTAMQYLTDARRKFIWFPVTGKEQFFDLQRDPQELCDLSANPVYQSEISVWRQRLIQLLEKRGDGFASSGQLITRPDGYGPEVNPG